MRWILAAGLSLTAGCLRIEGNVPEVCIHQENLAFDPSNFVSAESIEDAGLVPPGAAGGRASEGLPEGVELTGEAEQLLNERLSIEESFVFDNTEELDFLTDEHVSAEARFSHVRITLMPESGESFDFIDSFVVRMRPLDPNSQLSDIEIVQCDGGSCDFQSNEILQASASSADVVPYLQQGALEFALQFAGTLPREGWAVNADACLSATATAQVF